MNYIYIKLKINKLTLLSLFASFLLLGTNNFAQDGKSLYKQHCSACHKPLKDGVGPALQGAKEKWAAAGDDIYAWVKNPKAQYDAGVKTALAINYLKGGMPGQSVNNEEIDAILKYIDEYKAPVKKQEAKTTEDKNESPEESSKTWLWWLIAGSILLLIIAALWGVRQTLASVTGEGNEESAGTEIKGWLWRNKKLVSVVGFVLLCWATYMGSLSLYKIGVFENYIPEQPIAFTHKVHAGDNDIDCQYCHNSAEKSKHAGIPTVNVCMNCHKSITEASSGEKGTAEIAKIHKAAGYNPETRKYSGETEPIKWVKAHNLPDHVYFNHSQHVSVGKIDCENCHGPVKEFTVGRTASTKMINNMVLTGKDKSKNKRIIKLERPLLTMGWCIECHDKADVQTEGNAYYDEIHKRLKTDKELYKNLMEDGKLKVEELGGRECSKCHY